MNGSELICEILKQKGVKHVFGLFGDIQTDFAHAIRKSSIQWIGVHNEKSGGFMADIYARTSKKPGIVFSTLGPGATNLTSALANATQDRSPLIAISDQVPLKEFGLETHQYIDLAKAFHPETGLTKYNAVVKDVEKIPEILNKAFDIALTEPKGAVHISIPADIFSQPSDRKLLHLKPPAKSFAKRPFKGNLAVKEMKRMLNTERPGLVIAGGSIERGGAKEHFQAFIEKFKLPVLTTFRGKNAIPSDHKQCLGTISRHLGDIISEVIEGTDYLLLIGYDYNEGVKPSIWEGKAEAVYNIEVYDNRIVDIFNPPSIFGNLANVFAELLKTEPPKYTSAFDFALTKQKIKDSILVNLDVKDKSLHPKRITEAVNALYDKDSIIICDVGLNKYYSGLLLKATNQNQVLFSNGMSTMAFTSGALGAKIANPDKKVIALVGDGGFLMDFQELLTTSQYNQPVTWIVFNNGGLGLIEQAQLKQASSHYGVKFGKVVFAQLAQALGLYGFRVEPPMDLLPILRGVIEMDKPAVIDVPVQYTTKR